MEYIYDLFVNGVRKETHDRFEKAENAFLELCDQEPLASVSFIIYRDNEVVNKGNSYVELQAIREGLERISAWKPELKIPDFFDEYAIKHSGLEGFTARKEFNCTEEKKLDAINPSHYKDVVPGYQYAEMMVYMLANQEGVNSHLLGQVYKYLMRNGKKDEEVQELKKAQWYLNALINYKEQGKVIV
jgi:hypothetical protein